MNEAHTGIHIATLAPEKLGEFFGIPITNTLLMSFLVLFILISLAIFVRFKLKLIPGKIQAFFELVFEFVINFMTEILESKKAAIKYFPLVFTVFIFIFTANLIEFFPGIGSVGIFIHEGQHTVFAPILRSMNTDLNMTLALAIIVFLVIEVSGVIAIGFWKYAGKFISFKSPLAFVVGLIEIMSETVRLVSFSFRLFGNIFAGEVLVSVISYFAPYVLPSGVMIFETFVGFIQASIFALLTLLFIKLAITEPH